MEGTATIMETVLTNLTSFASWVWTQLGALMTQVQENPILFIVIFGLSLVGFTVGILRRLVRL